MSILPNMGSENWPVWIWKLVATVAMGLGQFQRFLPCDLGTGLHTHVPLASGILNHWATREVPDSGFKGTPLTAVCVK